MSTHNDSPVTTRRVGPILKVGEIADAAIEAAGLDNPEGDVRVSDSQGYVRVDATGEFIVRRLTMERILGRSFLMPELEVNLASFCGHLETTSEHFRWFTTVRSVPGPGKKAQ